MSTIKPKAVVALINNLTKRLGDLKLRAPHELEAPNMDNNNPEDSMNIVKTLLRMSISIVLISSYWYDTSL